MSTEGLLRTILWTEIRNALVADFPRLEVPRNAPKSLKKVVTATASDIIKLAQITGDQA